MNNIMFSSLTKKSIIDSYKKKEYKKTIQQLRGLFTCRDIFLNYLNENEKDIVEIELRKFREILYIWTVIEEFKKLLKGELEEITVAYMQEFDKDYVKEYFNEEEIAKIKDESNKYYIKQKNRLLLKNYEDGNFEYVMDSLRIDYKDYFDYEKNIDISSGISYNRAEIAPLREISQIFNHANFKISSNSKFNYEYAMLKNLIAIYKHMKIECTERYLLRQKKIGINIADCIINSDVLELFSVEERTILFRIYKEKIKDGLKVNKGLGLYNRIECTEKTHAIINILELSGSITEKYQTMKFKYKYRPFFIKRCLDSKVIIEAFKPEALEEVQNLLNGYTKAYEDIIFGKKQNKQQIIGEELGKIFEEFLNSNVDIDSYFSQNELLKKEYKRIQEYVSKYCPDIYEKFVNHRKDRIKKAALMVVDIMKKSDNFAEIDYYTITNIPYEEIKNYLRNVNIDDYIMFSIFVKDNPREKSLSDNGLKTVYEMTQSIRVVDSEGCQKMVNPTMKDKQYIITYLKYIGAPVTIKNISIGLRRYLNNNLYTEEKSLEKRITL